MVVLEAILNYKVTYKHGAYLKENKVECENHFI